MMSNNKSTEEDLIKSIFITNSPEDGKSSDISGRVTATSILNTIPKNATTKKLDNWEKDMSTEWRWRFLEFNNKRTVEISYLKNKPNSERLYYNKFGEWVRRDVPEEYDEFVIKVFYYYN